MDGMIGYDSTVRIGRTPSGGGAHVMTELALVGDIKAPDEQVDEVQVTHMKSPGRRRQFIAGLIDSGEVTVLMNDIPGSPTHIGATRAVIDANTAASQANTINWIFPTAIAAGGDVGRFRAQVAVAGLVHLGIYRRIGDNLVRRGFRAVFLPAGQVDVPVALPMQAGDFLGAFMGTARLRFLSNGGTGYYFSNTSTEQTSIAASSLNTTNLLLAQFILYQGQSALSQERERLRDTVADLSGRVVSLEYGGRDLQVFGTTDEARLADLSASPAAEWNFVFDDARPAGPVVEVELHARAAGTLRLKTGVLAGGSYATRASVTLNVVEGHNIIKTRLEMREGEMLAYKASARMVPFQSNSPLGTETATWYNGSTADLDSFSATLNATQQHLVKFTQAIGASEGEETARAGDLAEAGLGRISHARSGNDVTVSVSALGIAGTETLTTSTFTIPPASADFRYDLIVYDHGTQTLSRVAGAQRNDAANAQPVLTGASRQAVVRIRAGTAGITSVIAIPEMSGAVPLAARAMLDRRIAGARRACPKLMDKIFRRQPIRIMGFGDSITALGSGGSKWTANGAVRDAITGPYLANSGIVDAAVIAAVPLYTAGELGRGDDGGGRIHSRIGINWELVRALEARGWVLGTDLWYDNFAIPGTSSTDMWDDAANAPTDWLAALPMAGGARPDVVIFANAMNERPYAAGREERNFRIVDWIRSQGIEVIITTCARAATGLGDTRHANERLSRVARATGSGLIPLEAIWEDAVIGALGVNPEDLCLANRSNHPGIIELTRYGRILAEVVP